MEAKKIRGRVAPVGRDKQADASFHGSCMAPGPARKGLESRFSELPLVPIHGSAIFCQRRQYFKLTKTKKIIFTPALLRLTN